MSAAVIDTNVLLVANGKHEGVSAACRQECIQRLLQQQRVGVVVIDDSRRILKEYLQKTHPNQPKGPGDAFLKWLLQNATDHKRVHQVSITETADKTFEEFPNIELQREFDPSDRMFAAVSAAHPDKPPVWQAADCKWLSWWQRLDESGVAVEFLCPSDVARAYAKKFPRTEVPKLP